VIDPGRAANDDERLALSLFKAMEEGRIVDLITAKCSEDFVWANSGLPTLRGQKQIKALFARGGFRAEIPILQGQTHFTAEVIHIASCHGAVLTERIDHHWAADGRDLMTPHIAGVIEIKQGKITALRDFYDIACYQQSPTEIQTAFTLEAHQVRIAG